MYADQIESENYLQQPAIRQYMQQLYLLTTQVGQLYSKSLPHNKQQHTITKYRAVHTWVRPLTPQVWFPHLPSPPSCRQVTHFNIR